MRVAKTGFLPVVSMFVFAGCHHSISFQEIGYPIQQDMHAKSLAVILDAETLEKTVSIRSFMAGIAHRWDAKPGLMLKQIADVEFPQMFEEYSVNGSPGEEIAGNGPLVLEMTVPEYKFEDCKATVTVRAIGYRKEDEILLDETYVREGPSQGAKMYHAGAFGMKSAVRQSSFDAFRGIFAMLREDLSEVLEK